MRPHRLRVTAFGAFAGTEQVVFDDLEGLFLLHGETGAGKTTLLDAIAFALYGRVPGERGTARRLRSDHASPGTATEVELEATIGGRRLRITRKPEQSRPKKSGPGFTTEQASVRLAEFSPAGTWESKSTRIGEVDAEIENLMGMSAAQFFQVVLLPQGEFAKFLRADAKDKEALLQKLFGTDRFRKVEDWLADRRRATEKEVGAALDTVAQLVARIAQAAGTAVPDSAAVPDSPEPGPVRVSPRRPAASSAAWEATAWQATWAAALAERTTAERDAAAGLVGVRRDDLDVSLAAQHEAEQLADRQRRRRDALRRWATWSRPHPRSGACAPTPTLLPQPASARLLVSAPARDGQPRRRPKPGRCCMPRARNSRPWSAGWKPCVPSPARPARRTRPPRPPERARPSWPTTSPSRRQKHFSARPPVPQRSRPVTSPASRRGPPRRPGQGRPRTPGRERLRRAGRRAREARRTARGAPVRPGGVPRGPGRGAPHPRRAHRRHARRTGRVDDRRKPLPGLRLTRPPGPG